MDSDAFSCDFDLFFDTHAHKWQYFYLRSEICYILGLLPFLAAGFHWRIRILLVWQHFA